MKIFKTLIFLSLILFNFSCHTKKKVVESFNNDNVTNIVKPDDDVIKAFENISKSYVNYKGLNIKFSAEFSDKGNTTSFKGLMKIKRDSFIWISVRPALGIELARIKLTPDSVFFVDRINKQFYAGNYVFLEKKFGAKMNFFTVRSLLTDEMFIYPDSFTNNSNLTKLKFSSKNNIYTLFTENKPDSSDFSQQSVYNSSNFKIKNHKIVYSEEKMLIDILFDNFVKVGNNLLSHKIFANFKSPKKDLSFLLIYDKVSDDASVTSSFSVPDNYKPVDFEK